MSDRESTGTSRQRQPGRRLDGITRLEGLVQFTSGGVSIDVDVTEGSSAGTSGYMAAGSVGSTINALASYAGATLSAGKLTASGLAKGTPSAQYAVKVTYTLTVNGIVTPMALSGTVVAPSAFPDDAEIILQ